MNNETNNTPKSETSNPRYFVMDIVFYAGTLNYDQGAGNYQELKKITQWDGTVRIQVSRYALRYSILEMASKNYKEWQLAQKEQFKPTGKKNEPPQILDKIYKDASIIKIFPEWDLFGFLITVEKEKTAGGKKPKKGADETAKNETIAGVQLNDESSLPSDQESEAAEENKGSISRITPVKLTHAISLNSYNFDSHFTANLGIKRRATGRMDAGSDPVNVEEFKGFYVYNITIDLNRIGQLEMPDGSSTSILTGEPKNQRIRQLLETIMYLKRDIKGKREDISPWLVVAGIYNDMNYDTYMDRIELLKSKKHSIMREERRKQDGDKTIIEVIHQEESDNAFKPKFIIHDLQNNVKIYKRSDVELSNGQANKTIIESSKTEFLNKLYSSLNIQPNKNAPNSQG